MAKVNIFCPEAFEEWSYKSPDEVGIGNSEVNAIEQAWRLARRGHDVTVYAPLPAGIERSWRGVTWSPLNAADIETEPGHWIMYRCPKFLSAMPGPEKGQSVWLVCQDEDYDRLITPERAAKLERVIVLCRGQEAHWKARYPYLAHKVYRSSNGLRPELVKEALAEQIERDPFRLVYASSPDRALSPLVKIFTRAREFEPRLNLHVYYGLDNIEKLERGARLRAHHPEYGPKARRILRNVAGTRLLLDTEGLVFHGRVPQPTLYREFRKAGLSVYPCSGFKETGFVSGMEQMALGCIPIWAGQWAVEEHCLGGILADGDCNHDPMTVARMVSDVVGMAQDHALQEELRQKIMPLALERFNIEHFSEQWHQWILNPPVPVSSDEVKTEAAVLEATA